MQLVDISTVNDADIVSPPFKIHLPAYLVGHPCHSMCMEGKGQFSWVSSFLPPLYRIQVSLLLLRFFNKEFSMFLSQVWWDIPITLELRELRQRNYLKFKTGWANIEFQTSLGYRVRPCLNKPKNKISDI